MTDLAQLRQIAEAATPGPWHYIPKTFHGDDTELTAGVAAEDGTAVVCISALAEEGIENPIDALHIATFDPPTVLRLLKVANAAERWGQVRCRQYEDELMRALAELKAASDGVSE